MSKHTCYLGISTLIHLRCSYCVGWLSFGINASVLSMFAVGIASQWWLRTRHPRWFSNYNYILAAALDGGTQVRPSIRSIFDRFTKPCWAGHGFHSFICCSRSGREVSLVPRVVRITFRSLLTLVVAILTLVFLGGALIKEVSQVNI